MRLEHGNMGYVVLVVVVAAAAAFGPTAAEGMALHASTGVGDLDEFVIMTH